MDKSLGNKSQSKRQIFRRIMRYIAVIVVTVLLLSFIDTTLDYDNLTLGLVILAFAVIFFFITIPLIGLWIYSFVKAVRRRTKTDKILLCFHIADLLLLGIGIYLANQAPFRCDAFIMAKNYNRETGFWMRSIAESYREELPDSTRLYVEFDRDDASRSKVLSEKKFEMLKEHLNDFCGCIGIDISNYPNSSYSKLLFRRIGNGMYAFRLYCHPLTPEQQDSINADPCLIVYNDSTVFEFTTDVLEEQAFPGKQEFLEAKSKNDI